MDRPAGLRQCGRPGLHVGDVPGADAVELEVVHVPGGELVSPGVDEGLGARLAVVDALHAAAVVVVLAGPVSDLGGGVRGALDRGVLRYRLVRDARRHVQTELQPQGVHVVGDHLDAVLGSAGRELGGVNNPPAVLVHVGTLTARALVPEVVHVHVQVTGLGQAAFLHCERLRLDVGRGRIVPDEAPAAPAQRGGEPHAVGLVHHAGRRRGGWRDAGGPGGAGGGRGHRDGVDGQWHRGQGRR